jgi:hypothetical protein
MAHGEKGSWVRHFSTRPRGEVGKSHTGLRRRRATQPLRSDSTFFCSQVHNAQLRPHPGWRFPLSPRGATIVIAVTLSCARNRLQVQGEDWPQDDAAAILEPAAFVARPAACSRLVAQACSANEVPDTLSVTGVEKVSEPKILTYTEPGQLRSTLWGVSRCRADGPRGGVAARLINLGLELRTAGFD